MQSIVRIIPSVVLETGSFPGAVNVALQPGVNCDVPIFNIVPGANRQVAAYQPDFSVFRFRVNLVFPHVGDFKFQQDFIDALAATALKSNVSMNMMTVT